MKRIILLFAFVGFIFGANAQKFDGFSGKAVKNLKLTKTSVKASCDTLDPVAGDGLTLYSWGDNGYPFGVNAYGINSGEYFTYNGIGTKISELYIYIGFAYDSVGSNVRFNIHEPVNDTTPGDLLSAQDVPISQIVDDVNNGRLTHVVFDSAATITGSFIITIDNPTGGDTIALVTNQNGQSERPDEAIVQYDGTWYSAQELYNVDVSLALWPIVCTEDSTTGMESAELKNIVVYPTLTSGKILFGGLQNANVQVFDVTGNKVAEFNNVTYNIDIANLNNGIYILRVAENGKVLNKKIVLQK